MDRNALVLVVTIVLSLNQTGRYLLMKLNSIFNEIKIMNRKADNMKHNSIIIVFRL